MKHQRDRTSLIKTPQKAIALSHPTAIAPHQNISKSDRSLPHPKTIAPTIPDKQKAMLVVQLLSYALANLSRNCISRTK